MPKYDRREKKPGGGWRYYYDDHGPGGGNYSVHQGRSGNWETHYHAEDGQTHRVSDDGHHEKNPLTRTVIGRDHKSKTRAEAAAALHSKRQAHAADHGALASHGAIRALQNRINGMSYAVRTGERASAMHRILRTIEQGGSRAEAIEAGGEAGQALYDALRKQAEHTKKSRSAAMSMRDDSDIEESRLEKALAMLRGPATPLVGADGTEHAPPVHPTPVARIEQPHATVHGSGVYLDRPVEAPRVVKSKRPDGQPLRPIDRLEWGGVWDRE